MIPKSNRQAARRGLASLAALLLTAGCQTLPSESGILAVKDTVCGVDIGSSQPQTYHIRIGIVRRFYQFLPVSTNVLHVADYATSADGGVGLTHQNAKEAFRTGRYVFDETLNSTNR